MSTRLRRLSSAPLPRLPLHFAYPLNVPGPGAEGAVVLAELPDAPAMHVLRALRLVLAWCRGREQGNGFAPLPDFARWAETVEAAGDEVPRGELLALATALVPGADANAESVAAACYGLSEWALSAAAEGTSLLFAQAAALAHADCARSAWKTGRMLRDHGKTRDAEVWLRRAARVAVWTGDPETQNLAINSLGNLFVQQGNYHEAARHLTRASLLARRLRPERRGAVLHDLLVVYIALSQYNRAEEVAAAAAKNYGPRHQNLLRLAHDVALLWSQQGKYALAQPLYGELRRTVTEPELRMRSIAAGARCAGALGDATSFETYWAEGWQLATEAPPSLRNTLPAVLVDLGSGAASMGEWTKATTALSRGLQVARETDQHDSVSQAEIGLEMVARYEQLRVTTSRPISPQASTLAENLVRSLRGFARQSQGAGAP